MAKPIDNPGVQECVAELWLSCAPRLIWLVCLVGGCFQPEVMTPEQLNRGCVVMLPGIESGAWQVAETCRGLRDAGLDRAIDVIEWGDRPFGSLSNLIDLPANQQRAGRIAGHIAEYQRQHPGKPITLIGYSGGGGIAVLTADGLPNDVVLDRLVLIAAAVSPHHPLSRVCSHSRRGIVNFYSGRDWLTLGWGTRVFGTIDRQSTDSAGHVGFLTPDGRLLESNGLVQIPWTSDWEALGHGGDHVGWLSRAWSRDVLAPQIDPALSQHEPGDRLLDPQQHRKANARAF